MFQAAGAALLVPLAAPCPPSAGQYEGAVVPAGHLVYIPPRLFQIGQKTRKVLVGGFSVAQLTLVARAESVHVAALGQGHRVLATAGDLDHLWGRCVRSKSGNE